MVLSLSDDLIVINSFSKYFGMTGWRIGWMVAPTATVPVLDKLAQNFFLATSMPVQHAALAAFNKETLIELDKRRLQLQQRRDYLVLYPCECTDSALLWGFAARRSAKARVAPLSSTATQRRNPTATPFGLACQYTRTTLRLLIGEHPLSARRALPCVLTR